MSRSKRLIIALLATAALPAHLAIAAPAAQANRPAVQQRETREQPDRWGGQDTRSASSSDHSDDEADDDEDKDEDKGSDSADRAKDPPPYPKHPGELNGKLDLGGWV
jgi:hypothetical protein